MQRNLLILVLIPFSALSAMSLWQYGYLGVWEAAFQSTASAQVLADLLIALMFILTWLWRDAKSLGRNPWGWIALTLTFGSFGPLFYLLTRKEETQAEEVMLTS